MQEGKTIQSVAKAMRLLDLLAGSETSLSLAEISQLTGWPKSTVHGLLSTMREYAVVAQDENGHYGLGIRLFEYGCTLSSRWSVLDVVRPYIQHISYETGETVFFSILDRGEIITLDRAESRVNLYAEAEVGCRLPVHCTSQGKLFLAYMTQNERAALLQRNGMPAYTNHTITTMAKLERELHEIRSRGYATENSEYKVGLRSVAAPIVDNNGSVRYAIGIIGTFRQIETERFAKATEVVLKTAKQISKAL